MSAAYRTAIIHRFNSALCAIISSINNKRVIGKPCILYFLYYLPYCFVHILHHAWIVFFAGMRIIYGGIPVSILRVIRCRHIGLTAECAGKYSKEWIGFIAVYKLTDIIYKQVCRVF